MPFGKCRKKFADVFFFDNICPAIYYSLTNLETSMTLKNQT